WRSTARHGELMVRREEQHFRSSGTLFLDTRRRAHRGEGPAGSFEQAVSAAASIGVHLVRAGLSLRYVTDAGETLPAASADGGGGGGAARPAGARARGRRTGQRGVRRPDRRGAALGRGGPPRRRDVRRGPGGGHRGRRPPGRGRERARGRPGGRRRGRPRARGDGGGPAARGRLAGGDHPVGRGPAGGLVAGRPDRRGLRQGRLMRIRMTVMAGLATVAGSVGLSPLFEEHGWFAAGLGAVIAVACGGLLARRLRLPAPFNALFGLLALLVYLTVTYAADEAWLGFVPSPG